MLFKATLTLWVSTLKTIDFEDWIFHFSRSASCNISAKNHKRQRRKRESVTAKWEKSQTPKFLTAILTLPNLT